MLQAAGGVLALAALIDLDELKPCPHPPEVEDHWFWPDRARLIKNLAGDEYLSLIDGCCSDDLEAIFGPELQRLGWKFAVGEEAGNASLGCMRPKAQPRLEINRYGKVALQLREWSKPAYLPVTDIRFFEDDQSTPRPEVVTDVAKRLRRGVPVRLMLGLARAFRATGDTEKRHWLQVNGLCLEDRPVGLEP